MISVVDPNLQEAADTFTSYLSDNGLLVIGVVTGLAIFGLTVRWARKLGGGKSPV